MTSTDSQLDLTQPSTPSLVYACYESSVEELTAIVDLGRKALALAEHGFDVSTLLADVQQALRAQYLPACITGAIPPQ
jgi:hypothetical protein